jgi:2',3'-cyclic-nucleotide 2'-phosphodiesterase (5'-nucleotidase family)
MQMQNSTKMRPHCCFYFSFLLTSSFPLFFGWYTVGGNHELYEKANVEYMMRPGGWVDWWGSRYITSNILRTENTEENLGRRYRLLKGINSNLLVFGFLYDMPDATNLVTIDRVEDVMKENWFRRALTQEKYDAILVLAHMDLVDPLVSTILSGIRQNVGNGMPVQFITGHSHYRGYSVLDSLSTSFEAGRFLDTVGFVSFPTAKTVGDAGENATHKFERVFIDAKKGVLGAVLGLQEFDTPAGTDLSKFIEKTQEKMGLREEVGCAPHDYYLNATLDDEQSLWRLYRDEVVPKMFFSQYTDHPGDDPNKTNAILFVSLGSFRYDLFANSKLLVDDIVSVSPFQDVIYYMGPVSGNTILELNAEFPNFILIGDLDDQDPDRISRLFSFDFDVPVLMKALDKILDGNNALQPTNTSYTSTMLWLSYAMEYWPCPGENGHLPPWFPTPDHVTNSGPDDDGDMQRAIAIVIAVLFVLMGCVCFFFVCGVLKNYLTHTPVLPEELDTFKMDDEEDTDNENDLPFDDRDNFEIL